MIDFDKVFDFLGKFRDIYYIHLNIVNLFLYLIETLYCRSDDFIKRNSRYYNSTVAQVRDKAREWFLYTSAFDPDLKLTTSLMTSGSFVFMLLFHLFEKYFINIINYDKICLLAYLNNQSFGKKSIDQRLNGYIEKLILSNECVTQQLLMRVCPSKAQLLELSEERAHLDLLRSDKRNIWPSQRKGTRWLNEIKNLYSSIFSLLCLSMYTWMSALNQNMLLKNLQPNLGSMNLFRKKHSIDVSINTWVAADRISTITTITTVMVFDLSKRLTALKVHLEDFKDANRELRLLQSQIDELSWPDWYLMRRQIILRSRINKLALEAYIRLRFTLDSSVVSVMFLSAHLLILTSLSLIVLNLQLVVNISPREYNSMLMYVFLFYIGNNAILFICAYNFSYCSKIYRRLKTTYANMIIIPLKQINESSFSRELRSTTAHTYIVWHRFLRNDKDYVDKFTIKLFGLFLIDYRLIVRSNLYISYFVALHYYSYLKEDIKQA